MDVIVDMDVCVAYDIIILGEYEFNNGWSDNGRDASLS